MFLCLTVEKAHINYKFHDKLITKTYENQKDRIPKPEKSFGCPFFGKQIYKYLQIKIGGSFSCNFCSSKKN